MKVITIISACSLFLLTACSNNTNTADLLNQKATIPASFNFSQKRLKVIASFINKKEHTMSTLYGNELALNGARTGGEKVPGEELTLVTWNQQDDVHWFGAKIPAGLKSIEVVKTGLSTQNNGAISYSCYEGQALTLNSDTLRNQDRVKYIFDQKPSVLP
ncbi:hypothetical protein HDF24_25805 [Mucilaginibacter sp. X4EP1]|uniref:hypothetical protein n=1 Tax=Mucilaginibacter sp. X4EP1 TaxID=2723092 RepID=UPI0021682AF0|nr:hypothetical protein [Mucilaginibacter sp. X4EP1]MCS3816370.1 hypothetical protein [Mucilaginibacter sp. X4EP1]